MTRPLVEQAERSNPRRAFLLVSTVLGKHVPLPAATCRLAGAALGLRLGGDPRAEEVVEALLGDDAGAHAAILRELDRTPVQAMAGASILGFAETATGLAHQVAETLDASWLQTTTRHPDSAGGLTFLEAHSHAPDQWLRPLPAPRGPTVLVDDELSTGATAAELIRALHAHHGGSEYLVGSLLDTRPGGRGPLEDLADELGLTIEVTSLERAPATVRPTAGWSGGVLPQPSSGPPPPGAPVRDVQLSRSCPPERHGMTRADRADLRAAAAHIAAAVGPLPAGALVLGCGEHLALPQLHALAEGAETLTSSTTRSPALVVDRAGYPLRDGLAFPHPEEPTRPGYAYNVRPDARPAIVVHFAEPAHREAASGLLASLAARTAVTAVTLTP